MNFILPSAEISVHSVNTDMLDDVDDVNKRSCLQAVITFLVAETRTEREIVLTLWILSKLYRLRHASHAGCLHKVFFFFFLSKLRKFR